MTAEKIIMRAIVVTHQAAGPAGMKLVERPEPPAAINDVIVQIHASGYVPTETEWPPTGARRRGGALDLDRPPRPCPNTVDPRPRAGRSGHRSRLRHDRTVGRPASGRPRRLASRGHPGGGCSHR